MFCFAALLGGVLIPPRGILVCGLFLFPFFFFNTVLLFSEAWLRGRLGVWKGSYPISLWSGAVVTLACIVLFWPNLEELAHHTIFACAISVYSAFVLAKVLRKRSRCESELEGEAS